MKKRFLKSICFFSLLFIFCLSECDAGENFLKLQEDIVGKNESETETDTTAKDIMAEIGEEDGTEAKEVTVTSVSEGKYAYSTLSEEEKKVYDEVYYAIDEQLEKIPISTLDQEVLDKVYKAVTADHGEIFWASGYVYTQYTKGDEVIGIDFAPKYTMTLEERSEIELQIDGVVAEILSGIGDQASDYEKAKYVFEYLASEVSYETGASNNQNIISVFLNKATVCQGYACATQYLLEQLGIQAAVVTGTANGESHAWNLVRLDGAYYYIDTTWGNSTYQSEETDMGKYVNYNYFAVSTAELERTHTPNDYILLPQCTATADNYYVREGLYFTEWNPDAVGELLYNAWQCENGIVSVKFGSSALYTQYFSYLITEQHVSDYCQGITSLYYMEDEEQNVLTVKF